LQQLNAQRNTLSDSIAKLMKDGKKDGVTKIKTQVQELKEQIVVLEKQEQELNVELKNIVYSIPNIPDKSVPVGKDEKDNKEIRK
jgi:seryl-tRNA synthetase